jgi:hypothetical protein
MAMMDNGCEQKRLVLSCLECLEIDIEVRASDLNLNLNLNFEEGANVNLKAETSKLFFSQIPSGFRRELVELQTVIND